MFKFISGLFKLGGNATMTGAGVAVVGTGVDHAVTGGSYTERILSGLMQTLGFAQSDAGINTGFFGFYKALDKMLEMFVGAFGRSDMTDWARGGLQQMMGYPEDRIELGSPNKPETLSNPNTQGYIGGNPADANLEASADIPVAAAGITADVINPEALAEAAPAAINSIEAFLGSLQQDFASVVQDRVVDGQVIEGEYELNWEAVGEGTANNLKAAWIGVNTGIGGIAGFGADALNLVDNFTGLNWIPDQEQSYTQQWAEGMGQSVRNVQEAHFGGAANTESSALAMSFQAAAEFAPAMLGGGVGLVAKAGTIGYTISDPELQESVANLAASYTSSGPVGMG